MGDKCGGSSASRSRRGCPVGEAESRVSTPTSEVWSGLFALRNATGNCKEKPLSQDLAQAITMKTNARKDILEEKLIPSCSAELRRLLAPFSKRMVRVFNGQSLTRCSVHVRTDGTSVRYRTAVLPVRRTVRLVQNSTAYGTRPVFSILAPYCTALRTVPYRTVRSTIRLGPSR